MWCTSAASGRLSGRATAPSPRRAGTAPGGSAVLGARGGVAGGGHALDRGNLVGGDRRGLGGGLRQRGGRGVVRRGRLPTGQELALPVGQRLLAPDDGLRGLPPARGRPRGRPGPKARRRRGRRAGGPDPGGWG